MRGEYTANYFHEGFLEEEIYNSEIIDYSMVEDFPQLNDINFSSLEHVPDITSLAVNDIDIFFSQAFNYNNIIKDLKEDITNNTSPSDYVTSDDIFQTTQYNDKINTNKQQDMMDDACNNNINNNTSEENNDLFFMRGSLSSASITKTLNLIKNKKRKLENLRIKQNTESKPNKVRSNLEYRRNKPNKCYHLWDFLRDILSKHIYPSSQCAEWVNENGNEFRITNTKQLSQLWGIRKHAKTTMTYDKLSRTIRYYCTLDILKKVQGKRLHFKFSDDTANLYCFKRKPQPSQRPIQRPPQLNVFIVRRGLQNRQ